GGGEPMFVNDAEMQVDILSLKETRVCGAGMVNVETFGYAGTWATLVNAPAIPMPADIAFLEGGNPGTLVIGGGIGAAAPPAIAGVTGNNPSRGIRHYFTYTDDLRFIKGKQSWSMAGWSQKSQQGPH